MNHSLNRLIAALLVGTLLLAAPGPVMAQGSETEQTAEGMFAALNEWRLSQNLAPFKYNDTLEALAYLQLQYLLTKPDIPKNIHDGILGEGIRDRALWEPFSWPYYDIPERINVVEISVAQRTIRQGITWWKNSPIHNESATNPYYREAGVAALPYEYGTIFVAVLGGRPDVLPALVHPDGQTLYLTQESFWGQSPTSIGAVREIRLLDSDGTPLGDWQAWQDTLSLPEVSGDTLTVEYTDGRSTVTTEVNLTTDVISLPNYESAEEEQTELAAETETLPPETADLTMLAADAQQLTLQATVPEPVYLANFHLFALPIGANPVDQPFTSMFPGLGYAAPNACFILTAESADLSRPEECTGPLIAFSVPDAEVFWYDPAREARTTMFVISEKGRLLADCQDAKTVCTFQVEAYSAALGPEGGEPPVSRTLELIYNPGSFALLNRGGQHLNLFGLEFVGETGSLPIETWNVATSSAQIGYFPADGCLQTWGVNNPKQPKPSSCDVRHAWTTINANQIIWVKDTFEVQYNGATLATCEASAGQCVFELP